MRLGIVSDIHCNLAGLDLALERMGPVDQVICAGDACYEYRFSNAVAARLKEIGARYVLGNHEDVLLGPHGAAARAAAEVDPALVAWTAEQPHLIRADVGGKRLLLFHATPWAPFKDYLFPHSAALERLADLDADIVIYGHTHCQLQRRIGRTLVVNPGSTGEARDPQNGFQLSYAVVDTSAEAVEFGNFADPARAAPSG